jgi:hypothetical protein
VVEIPTFFLGEPTPNPVLGLFSTEGSLEAPSPYVAVSTESLSPFLVVPGDVGTALGEEERSQAMAERQGLSANFRRGTAVETICRIMRFLIRHILHPQRETRSLTAG